MSLYSICQKDRRMIIKKQSTFQWVFYSSELIWGNLCCQSSLCSLVKIPSEVIHSRACFWGCIHNFSIIFIYLFFFPNHYRTCSWVSKSAILIQVGCCLHRRASNGLTFVMSNQCGRSRTKGKIVLLHWKIITIEIWVRLDFSSKTEISQDFALITTCRES